MNDAAIRSGDLRTLFIEQLGWDRAAGQQAVSLDGESIVLDRVAHKRGVGVFLHKARREAVQTERYVRSIQTRLAALAHEHILIVADAESTVQTWAWLLRDAVTGKPQARLHPLFTDRIPQGFLDRLEELVVTLEQEEETTLLDVTRRLESAFDGDADQTIFFRSPGYSRRSAELARRMKAGGESDFHAFVVFHLQLAVWFSKRYARLTRAPEDMVQAANAGLVRAARLYDPDLGTAFSTFAYRIMQTDCWRALPACCRLGAPPHHVYKWGLNLRRAVQRMRQDGDERRRSSLLIDAGQKQGLSHHAAADIDRFMHARRLHPISMRRQAALVGAVEYSDRIPCRFREPLTELIEAEQARLVLAAIDALEPRDSRIIRMRFGFDCEEQTLEQVGATYHVTRERIRQCEAKALRLLGRRLRKLIGRAPLGSESGEQTRYDPTDGNRDAVDVVPGTLGIKQSEARIELSPASEATPATRVPPDHMPEQISFGSPRQPESRCGSTN